MNRTPEEEILHNATASELWYLAWFFYSRSRGIAGSSTLAAEGQRQGLVLATGMLPPRVIRGFDADNPQQPTV